MRYILYARKSSESEDRQVQSIDDQLRELRDAALKQQILVVHELTEARSAKNPGSRPVFEEVLGRIENGEADGIFCWSINRLSRNPIDSGKLSWMLQRGVLKSIKTIDREYRPEDNVLLLAVESGVANQYILDLSKAVVRGMEGKASRGWFPGRPPQGYKVDAETRTIVTREPQFSMLRRAWELLLTGSYTVAELHAQLQKWGYPINVTGSTRGLPMSQSSLHRIFGNPFYQGTFRFRGQLYDGRHKPMVSPEEFHQAQQILHNEFQVSPKRHDFPFTGLMRCGACGCAITAERKVKRYRTTGRVAIYDYYRCTRRRGACGEPCVTARYVEERIAKLLSRVTISQAFGQWLLEVIDRSLSEQPEIDSLIERQQSSNVEGAKRRLTNLIDLRVSGEIAEEEFAQLRLKYQKEVLVRQAEAEATRERHRALRSAIRFGMSANSRFTAESDKTKRQIAKVANLGYILKDGIISAKPHPFLSQIARLEPPQISPDMVQAGALAPQNSVWWAWREEIRNLLNGVKLDDWCSMNETMLDGMNEEMNLDDPAC